MQSHFAQLRNMRPFPIGSVTFGSARSRVEFNANGRITPYTYKCRSRGHSESVAYSSGRIIANPEVILRRDLIAGEFEICREIPAPPVKHHIAGRPHPEKSGGLNGSMQHLLKVFL